MLLKRCYLRRPFHAFVRSPVNSPHKGSVTRKMFPFDDVIMSSSAWRSQSRTTLLCLVMLWWYYDFLWIYPYPSGLLHWQCGNRMNGWLPPTWWRHQIEAFFSCYTTGPMGPVASEYPHKGPVMLTLMFLRCGPHKLLNKQLNGRWFEATWPSSDVIVMNGNEVTLKDKNKDHCSTTTKQQNAKSNRVHISLDVLYYFKILYYLKICLYDLIYRAIHVLICPC